MQEETILSINDDIVQLRQAVANSDLELVKSLVKKPGLNKSLRDDDGLPLVYSVIKKIGKKPDNAPYSQNQLTAYKIAKLLIKYDFDLNQKDTLGNAALYQAVKRKHVKLIALLISKNADVNAKNQDGKTPLCLAVESNDVEIFTQIVNAENIDSYVIVNNPTRTEKAKTVFDVLKERQTQSGTVGERNRLLAKQMQDRLTERVRLKNLKVQHIDRLPIVEDNTHQTLLLKMQQDQRKIFMSYSWSEAYSTVPMALSCCAYLKQRQIAYYLDRDEETGIAAIGQGHLERFMRIAISHSHVTIAFINEAYLMSRNCLFELSQFWDKSDKSNPRFKDNLHIVIHPEFNLYGNATNATKYINYWEERKKGNNQNAKTIDDIEQQRHHIDEAKFLKEVADNIAGMIRYIAAERVYPTYEQLRTSGYYEVMEAATRLDPPSLQETSHAAHGLINLPESMKLFQTKSDCQNQKERVKKEVEELKQQVERNKQAEEAKRQQFEAQKDQQIKTIQQQIVELEKSPQKIEMLEKSLDESVVKNRLEADKQMVAKIAQLKIELEAAEAAKATQKEVVSDETKRLEEKQTDYEKTLQDLDMKIAAFDKQQSERQTKQEKDTTILDEMQKNSTDLVTQVGQLKEKINGLEAQLKPTVDKDTLTTFSYWLLNPLGIIFSLFAAYVVYRLSSMSEDDQEDMAIMTTAFTNCLITALPIIPMYKLNENNQLYLTDNAYLARNHTLEGDNHYTNDDCEKAIEYYNKAIEQNPNDDVAHNNRGLTYHKLGKYSLAVFDFNKAIDINPKHPIHYYNKALAKYAQGKISQAIDNFLIALSLTKDEDLKKRYNFDLFKMNDQTNLNEHEYDNEKNSLLACEKNLQERDDKIASLEQKLETKADVTNLENLISEVNATKEELKSKIDNQSFQTLEQKLQNKANTIVLNNLIDRVNVTETQLASKASTTDLDDLSDKVNVTETNLNNLAGRLNTAETQLVLKVDHQTFQQTLEQSLQGKANTADLSNLTNRVNATETQVALKANATDLDDLSDKVNVTETNLNNLAGRLNTTETQLALTVDHQTFQQILKRSLQGKANTADLSNLTNRVNTTETQVALKANATDLDDLRSKMNTTLVPSKSSFFQPPPQTSWEVVVKKSKEVLGKNLVKKEDISKLLDEVGKGHLKQVEESLNKNSLESAEVQLASTVDKDVLTTLGIIFSFCAVYVLYRLSSMSENEKANLRLVSPLTAVNNAVSQLRMPVLKQPISMSSLSFFQPSPIMKLLDEVGKGHLDQVREMIQKNPALVYAMGNMTDVTGKAYKDITVLQYAFIAGDIDMCEMILNTFKEAGETGMIRYQLSTEEIKRHGGVYTLEPTLKSYKDYNEKYDQWSDAQRESHWCKQIGRCQQTWPAWLRYEFTEEGTDAPWCKQSVCGRPQNRDDDAYGIAEKNCWGKGYDNKYKLGDTFARIRGDWDECSGVVHHAGRARGLVSSVWRPYAWGIECMFTLAAAGHDHIALDKEEAAIKEYRVTLETRFQLSHSEREIASETLTQQPTPQPRMG